MLWAKNGNTPASEAERLPTKLRKRLGQLLLENDGQLLERYHKMVKQVFNKDKMEMPPRDWRKWGV
jgi:hypothetical protein